MLEVVRELVLPRGPARDGETADSNVANAQLFMAARNAGFWWLEPEFGSGSEQSDDGWLWFSSFGAHKAGPAVHGPSERRREQRIRVPLESSRQASPPGVARRQTGF